jgi:protein SCO1/2
MLFGMSLCCLLFSCSPEKKKLPVLSFHINDQGIKEQYTIDFGAFSDQNGKIFDETQLEHKISTANFFFTHCPSICPPMRNKLITLAKHFENEPDFLQVSITIDPKRDSIPVLKDYAMQTSVPFERWQLLRGDSLALAKLSSQLMTNFTPNEAGTNFYHSSYVALLDKKKQLRGFYDLLREVDLEHLKEDVKILLEEDSLE